MVVGAGGEEVEEIQEQLQDLELQDLPDPHNHGDTHVPNLRFTPQLFSSTLRKLDTIADDKLVYIAVGVKPGAFERQSDKPFEFPILPSQFRVARAIALLAYFHHLVDRPRPSSLGRQTCMEIQYCHKAIHFMDMNEHLKLEELRNFANDHLRCMVYLNISMGSMPDMSDLCPSMPGSYPSIPDSYPSEELSKLNNLKKTIKQILYGFSDAPCGICFQALTVDSNLMILGCHHDHRFHAECFVSQVTGETSCPICNCEFFGY